MVVPQVILLLIVVVAVFLLYKLVRNIFALVVNSVIGLFALLGFNYIFNAGVAINFWSVLITAVGGIFGFIA